MLMPVYMQRHYVQTRDRVFQTGLSFTARCWETPLWIAMKLGSQSEEGIPSLSVFFGNQSAVNSLFAMPEKTEVGYVYVLWILF